MAARARAAYELFSVTSARKRIFLTGASGNMGRAGLDALLERERFDVVALALPTKRDRRALAPYIKRGVQVVWGDLRNFEDVLACVNGADVVLHAGGMVSPLADSQPALTRAVNVGAAQNIVRAIAAQPDPGRVRLVSIGSVAQTGNRPAPIHWGRVGDPIRLSAFDTYAITKTEAERIVVDSGVPHWVSLRQTGIARMAASEPLDPIMFHAPLAGVLEWVTLRDSGVLLANLCEDSVPPQLWGGIHNIGGGQPNRLTNLELFARMLRAVGVRDHRRVLEPNWFALQNFHGHWFSDSDALEALVPFRTQTLDAYLAEQARRVPWGLRLGGVFPALVHQQMERVARSPGGTLRWLADDDREHIAASFGTREAWSAIGGWERVKSERPSDIPTMLDHGYDEAKPREDFTFDDVQRAARFRGGNALSRDLRRGDWRARIEWTCHAGHRFSASLNLVLMGGHWCPACISDPGCYPELARHSEFFNQVFAPLQGIRSA